MQKSLEDSSETGQVPTANNSTNLVEALQKALQQDKKKKEKPHLKVNEKLATLSLKHLHPSLWPKGTAADDLLHLVTSSHR